VETFGESGFAADVLECTSAFKKPTPVQSQTWPIILSDRDVIGIAETGSGKTLAFGLPAITKFKSSQRHPKGKIFALILAPTRELAMQTYSVLNEVSQSTDTKVVCVYGGASKYTQAMELRGKPQFVVGTPGRLLDFINDGTCDLSNVSYLVLDEADRMLDLGFEKDIRSIIQKQT